VAGLDVELVRLALQLEQPLLGLGLGLDVRQVLVQRLP
jgi:hypothetical protein